MYPDANNAGTFSFTVVSELVVSNSFPGNVNAFTAFFAVAKTFFGVGGVTTPVAQDDVPHFENVRVRGYNFVRLLGHAERVAF